MKISCFISLFCLIFFPSVGTLSAQEFSVAGGMGTPEMVNIGLKIRIDQNQYGLNIGANPGYKNENFTVSGDFYHHFSGRSGHTSLRPWFFKTGLTYMRSEGQWEERMNLLFVPRMGRQLNITPQFGVALEVGLMLMLIDKNRAKKERTDEVTGDLDLIGSGFFMGSAGFKFFYRLDN